MRQFSTIEPVSAPTCSSELPISAILNKDYSYFDISPRTGFLDIENTASLIPSNLREHDWEVVLASAKRSWVHAEPLSNLEDVDSWRSHVQNMVVWESLSPALAKDTALLRRAYVVLCMLGHFYLHGAPKNSRSGSSDSESAHRKNFVPAPIAIPWLLVSKALGLKPVLSYASQILWNCAYNDISLLDDPLPSGQIRILETFTGDSSEVAFDISPARVELEGAVILKAILDVLATHFQGSDLIQSQSAVTLELLRIESALRRMKSHLLILKKDCDPFHFYWKLRPLISGSGPEGWTYELSGGSVINLQVGGSTAGSSSLLQALDSFLGLHLSDSQISFRRAMQEYMPQGHRLFVQELEKLKASHVISPAISTQLGFDDQISPLRAFVLHASHVGEECHGPDLLRISGLKLGHAYNSVVRGLKEFRDEHFRIVSLFIINQASKAQKNIENNPSFVEESSLKNQILRLSRRFLSRVLEEVIWPGC